MGMLFTQAGQKGRFDGLSPSRRRLAWTALILTSIVFAPAFGGVGSASGPIGGGTGRVAYACISGQAPQPGDICVSMLDGSKLQRLTHSAKNEFQPAWSPDGKRIVFRAAPAGLPGTSSLADIAVINADGTRRKDLTHNPGRGNWDPAWSPNGKLIAFGSGGPDLWTIRPDGTRPRRLTRGGGESPAWSPDGKRIAFMSIRATGRQYDIYVMNANGSGIRRLTSSLEEDGYPDWSPDGKMIAFSTGPPDGKWSIWLMNADGSHKRLLVRFVDDQSAGFPDWSPDGRKIIFSTFDGIYIVDADGSNLTKTKINQGDMPVWQPR
jgi:TolB protein